MNVGYVPSRREAHCSLPNTGLAHEHREAGDCLEVPYLSACREEGGI